MNKHYLSPFFCFPFRTSLVFTGSGICRSCFSTIAVINILICSIVDTANTAFTNTTISTGYRTVTPTARAPFEAKNEILGVIKK